MQFVVDDRRDNGRAEIILDDLEERPHRRPARTCEGASIGEVELDGGRGRGKLKWRGHGDMCSVLRVA